MVFVVGEEYNGKLLRDFIRSGCSVSRKTLCALKEKNDGILLNGTRVTVRAVVKAGDEVSLAIEDTAFDENPYVCAEGTMPPIAYEDDSVIAVNKPAGMPTHTSFGHYGDALSNAVCGYLKSKGLPFVFRAVNRLDLDTSGIVLIAKNKYYSSILSKSLGNGEFVKTYIAVVDGDIPDSGVIEGYIEREGKSIIKRCFSKTPTPEGEYSLTEYKTLAEKQGKRVLLVSPKTGRTHQIRVHLASIGAPIIGDTMYGGASSLIPRQALHAYSLTFPSPITKKAVTVYAPLTEDIVSLLDCFSLSIELNNDEN